MVVDMLWYMTWGSHWWLQALSQAHPDGEVDPWSMTIDLPMVHFTGTFKVRRQCGKNMITMVCISDMEPYPSPWVEYRISWEVPEESAEVKQSESHALSRRSGMGHWSTPQITHAGGLTL